MRPSSVVVPALAAIVLGVAASSASAAFVGSVKDPADQADPGRDITSATFTYSRTGRMFAQVNTRAGVGDDPSVRISVWAGTMGPQGCNVYPAVGFIGYAAGNDARWHLLRGPEDTDWGFADRERGGGGPIARFSADRSDLRGLRPTCVTASVFDAEDVNTVYDEVTLGRLTAVPELQSKLGAVPSVLRPGRRYSLRVTVSNPGDAPTGRIRIGGTAGPGVKVIPKNVPSIAVGKSRTAVIPVVVASTATTRTAPLKLAIAAGRLRSRVESRLYVSRPSTSSPKKGTTPRSPRLCNRWVPDLSGQTGGSLALVFC